jgi:hypothetical protein
MEEEGSVSVSVIVTFSRMENKRGKIREEKGRQYPSIPSPPY